MHKYTIWGCSFQWNSFICKHSKNPLLKALLFVLISPSRESGSRPNTLAEMCQFNARHNLSHCTGWFSLYLIQTQKLFGVSITRLTVTKKATGATRGLKLRDVNVMHSEHEKAFLSKHPATSVCISVIKRMKRWLLLSISFHYSQNGLNFNTLLSMLWDN